jgi:glycine cleavage system H protein
MAKPNPTDRKYTKEHEWAKPEENGIVVIGITDYAQELLTDIVFVELPDIGKKLHQMQQIAVVESVKSVSDIYAPVSGEVVEVNHLLEEQPELINRDAFGEGWIAKIRTDNPLEMEKLMDADAYTAMTREEGH